MLHRGGTPSGGDSEEFGRYSHSVQPDLPATSIPVLGIGSTPLAARAQPQIAGTPRRSHLSPPTKDICVSPTDSDILPAKKDSAEHLLVRFNDLLYVGASQKIACPPQRPPEPAAEAALL